MFQKFVATTLAVTLAAPVTFAQQESGKVPIEAITLAGELAENEYFINQRENQLKELHAALNKADENGRFDTETKVSTAFMIGFAGLTAYLYYKTKTAKHLYSPGLAMIGVFASGAMTVGAGGWAGISALHSISISKEKKQELNAHIAAQNAELARLKSETQKYLTALRENHPNIDQLLIEALREGRVVVERYKNLPQELGELRNLHMNESKEAKWMSWGIGFASLSLLSEVNQSVATNGPSGRAITKREWIEIGMNAAGVLASYGWYRRQANQRDEVLASIETLQRQIAQYQSEYQSAVANYLTEKLKQSRK